MGRIVTSPIPKGDVSREVADSVSSSLVQHCERCRARHVSDGLFRAAGRQAQLVIGPKEDRATMLYPRPRVKQQKIAHPRGHLLGAYFRVNGPTSRTLYRDWQETGTTGVGELWDELAGHLVQVQIDGKRFDLPEYLIDSVQKAEPADGVALVPRTTRTCARATAHCSWRTRRAARNLFKALSGPGALLVDGEIAGTWRYRRTDAEVTIEAFVKLRSDHRNAAVQAASAVATSTGDDEPTIIWS